MWNLAICEVVTTSTGGAAAAALLDQSVQYKLAVQLLGALDKARRALPVDGGGATASRRRVCLLSIVLCAVGVKPKHKVRLYRQTIKVRPITQPTP